MTALAHNPLAVVASLSEDAMTVSLRELESRDRLTIALREAIRYGTSVDDLSEITGLTPLEIRRRVKSELHVLSELNTLAS